MFAVDDDADAFGNEYDFVASMNSGQLCESILHTHTHARARVHRQIPPLATGGILSSISCRRPIWDRIHGCVRSYYGNGDDL